MLNMLNEKTSSHVVSIKNIAKSVVPTTWVHSVKNFRRDFIFRRAMQQFIRDPEQSIAAGSNVLADLIYGWGNESWSADTSYLVCCIKHAQMSGGPILECGSGLSTILLAVIAEKKGIALWTLEHKPEWSARVTEYLKRFRIAIPHIHASPLRNYGEFSWYDPPIKMLPARFELVVCDGPPGATLGGRYGLSPVLGKRLSHGCVVLLDDAERKQERDIADRWSMELNAQYQTVNAAKPYIILRTN